MSKMPTGQNDRGLAYFGVATEDLFLTDQDFVIARLLSWRLEGLQGALVTVVAIDGTSPRPLGSQMAVSADGRYCGYLSGGCLERAVVEEAQQAIAAGVNRRLRYGPGSRYADIRLPCGAALELYIDQSIDTELLQAIATAVAARQPVALATDLESGCSEVAAHDAGRTIAQRSAERFLRPYPPALRLALAGVGPTFVRLALLARASGLDVVAAGPDFAEIEQLSAFAIPSFRLMQAGSVPPLPLDRFTASVMLYHEHEWEAAAWPLMLVSDCFYLGAQGSPATHRVRVDELRSAGFAVASLARIHSPAGLVKGGRSATEIALSILAEVVKEGRDKGLRL